MHATRMALSLSPCAWIALLLFLPQSLKLSFDDPFLAVFESFPRDPYLNRYWVDLTGYWVDLPVLAQKRVRVPVFTHAYFVIHVFQCVRACVLCRVCRTYVDRLGLSQLFFSAYYSIQNFPPNAPIIPKDCPIILNYSHQKLRKVHTIICTAHTSRWIFPN